MCMCVLEKWEFLSDRTEGSVGSGGNLCRGYSGTLSSKACRVCVPCVSAHTSACARVRAHDNCCVRWSHSWYNFLPGFSGDAACRVDFCASVDACAFVCACMYVRVRQQDLLVVSPSCHHLITPCTAGTLKTQQTNKWV